MILSSPVTPVAPEAIVGCVLNKNRFLGSQEELLHFNVLFELGSYACFHHAEFDAFPVLAHLAAVLVSSIEGLSRGPKHPDCFPECWVVSELLCLEEMLCGWPASSIHKERSRLKKVGKLPVLLIAAIEVDGFLT